MADNLQGPWPMLSSMHKFEFDGCSVTVDTTRLRVVSRWNDGTVLLALPSYDDESYARAQSLGFTHPRRTACWEMTSTHDLLHHVVAHAQGAPFSMHLWRVARGDALSREDSDHGDMEERMVLLLQRALNSGLQGILQPFINVEAFWNNG